jgi:hypothetical protein
MRREEMTLVGAAQGIESSGHISPFDIAAFSTPRQKAPAIKSGKFMASSLPLLDHDDFLASFGLRQTHSDRHLTQKLVRRHRSCIIQQN